MSVKLKSIVVSYSVQDEAFHRESLLEYTQGNALRILKNCPTRFHAIAVVETNEEAERAMAVFSRLQRVARGVEEPTLVKPRMISAAEACV
jgi:hypothetical protein